MNSLWIIILAISMSFTNCTNGQKESAELLGSDIRLFKDVAWKLAQAVDKEDTVTIKRILSKRKFDVDIREPRFGMTLLIWAVCEKKHHSAEMLLRYGANPNLQDTHDGTSAITAAADNFDSSDMLRLVLSYGGDPNNEVVSDIPKLNQTPLVVAASCNLESVKILIEAGADINRGVEKRQSALFNAVLSNQVKIVKFLLIDKKAEFMYPVLSTLEGEDLYIVNFIRNWVYPLDSEEYKIKMEIVDYLKANGMDYWQTNIPANILRQYPKEFLSKY